MTWFLDHCLQLLFGLALLLLLLMHHVVVVPCCCHCCSILLHIHLMSSHLIVLFWFCQFMLPWWWHCLMTSSWACSLMVDPVWVCVQVLHHQAWLWLVIIQLAFTIGCWFDYANYAMLAGLIVDLTLILGVWLLKWRSSQVQVQVHQVHQMAMAQGTRF